MISNTEDVHIYSFQDGPAARSSLFPAYIFTKDHTRLYVLCIMTVEMNDLSNAGPVRPLNGLAHEPDWIDCPFCRRRTKTQVTSVASEQTKQTQVHWCIGGFWALGLCYFLPKWLKMYHNKEHRCPSCDEKVAIVRHDQQVGNANYVPSAFAAGSQPPQQKNMAYKGPAISPI